MKQSQNSEKLYEEYADTAAALVMDRYLAALAEYLAAKDCAPVEIGAELDGRCRKIIKKGLAKRRRRRFGKRLLRALGIGAGVLLLLLGVFAVLVSTVESVRVPVVNYFIDKRESYLEISGAEQGQRAAQPGASGDVLADLVPAGYELQMFDTAATGDVAIIYKAPQGGQIAYFASPPSATVQFDSEDAVTEDVTISRRDAMLIEKNGYTVVWFGEDGAICRLFADALSREEILAMAEAIEGKRENAPAADSADVLAGLIPPEYELFSLEGEPNSILFIDYRTSQDDYIRYAELPSNGVLAVDNEGAVTENITISGLDAILVEKNGYQLVWFSADTQWFYKLEVSSLRREEVVALAEAIESKRGNAPTADSSDVLAGLVPPGYERSVLDTADPENIAVIYTNPQGEQIGYFTTPGYGTLHADTEDAVVENVTVCGLDAILIEKNGYHLLWFGADNESVYELVGTALTRDEILAMAEAIERGRGEETPSADGDTILTGLIPPGYELQLTDQDALGNLTVFYTTAQDDSIVYYEMPTDGTTLRLDTEDAVTENITISGLDAILVEKRGYQLVWFSADNQWIYQLDVSSLSREEVVALAEAIESRR